MVCKKCGNLVNDNAKFCPYCGSAQSVFKDLVTRAVEGENQAIAELYSRTIEKVYFTVRVLIKDEDTANDIVQDSYIKGFKSLHQLKDADSYQAWMKRIAHNKAVDWIRGQKVTYVEEFTSADEAEVQERMEERIEYLPEDFADQRETARLLNEILDALPEEQRVVLCMYYYDQMSSHEIADELGISTNTVKSRLIYARKKVELQVRELESKGTRLYSLAPIPFFIALLHTAEKNATEIPGAAVFEAVKAISSGVASVGAEEFVSEGGKEFTRQAAEQAGSEVSRAGAQKMVKESAKAAVRSTGKTAISGAAKAGAGAAKGVALKGIAAALAVTMVGAGAVAGVKVGEQYFEKKQEEKLQEEQRLAALSVTPEPTPEPTPTPEVIVEELTEDTKEKERDLKMYSRLINSYFTAIENNWTGYDEDHMNFFDEELLPLELGSIENMGYALNDFDKDGVSELIIADTSMKITEMGSLFSHEPSNKIIGIYTIKYDQVKGIQLQPNALGPSFLCEDGKILWYYQNGSDQHVYEYTFTGNDVSEEDSRWMQDFQAGTVFNDCDNPQKWWYVKDMINGMPEDKIEITSEEARKFVDGNKLFVTDYVPFSQLQRYRSQDGEVGRNL